MAALQAHYPINGNVALDAPCETVEQRLQSLTRYLDELAASVGELEVAMGVPNYPDGRVGNAQCSPSDVAEVLSQRVRECTSTVSELNVRVQSILAVAHRLSDCSSRRSPDSGGMDLPLTDRPNPPRPPSRDWA
jgi:hypothetical protein